MKPLTLIQRPLANATSAKETTKLGNNEVINTTRLSAASRSRKSHKTHVKNACAVGWKLESQYEIVENTREMKTIQAKKDYVSLRSRFLLLWKAKAGELARQAYRDTGYR